VTDRDGGPVPVLVVVGGLPASGKTTVGRALAARIGAAFVRIDSIEQAMVTSLGRQAVAGPAGYVVGYAVAADQLRLGLSVVAESVNPLAVTRDAWLETGRSAGADVLEVEVVCSDPVEHRRRAEGRRLDIPGLTPPTWREITERDYEPWHRDRVVVDTAGVSVESCVRALLDHLGR